MIGRWRAAWAALVLGYLCAAAVACAGGLKTGSTPAGTETLSVAAGADQAAVDARATFPPGPQGALIAEGYRLITQTSTLLPRNVTARMSCAACHTNAGRVPHAGSFLGLYALFPQWNKRAHRFIALQDRIAECFLYSMNGTPPAYSSREMIAMTAYIAWLSRGAPVGVGFPGQEPVRIAAGPPNVADGARLYTQRCAECHGADGNGVGLTYPPLWGPQSFNDKAGMAHLTRMAPFVRVAMPLNAPGSLTDQQALDVAAFVLTHSRPHFRANRLIAFPPQPASFF